MGCLWPYWAVKQGGVWQKLYQNSLTLAYTLFISISFYFHAYGSNEVYRQQQLLSHEEAISFSKYLVGSLWFESFQNW